MYETEQLLVDEITSMIESRSKKVPASLRAQNQVILTEVNLGYGIADIVLTECEDVKETRNVFLTSADVNILSIINECKAVSLEELILKTRNSKLKMSNSLKKLIELGLIKKSEGSFFTENKYKPTVKKSTAIEVKLRNWKRALKQAYRYKWFSDKSFVCLPHENIGPAMRNIDSFKKIAVGLIGICPDKGMKILYNPKSDLPVSEDMSILLNESVLTKLNCFG